MTDKEVHLQGVALGACDHLPIGHGLGLRAVPG